MKIMIGEQYESIEAALDARLSEIKSDLYGDDLQDDERGEHGDDSNPPVADANLPAHDPSGSSNDLDGKLAQKDLFAVLVLNGEDDSIQAHCNGGHRDWSKGYLVSILESILKEEEDS
jgi:hypothetical protein